MKRNLFTQIRRVTFLATSCVAILLSAFTVSLSSCSDDDDNADQQTAPDSISTILYEDQLATISEYLVRVDSMGNLTMRVNGVPLTEFNSDTTVVFIGVADLAEAKAMFEDWLPQGIATTTNGDIIVASPTDTLDHAQGTVTFAPSTSLDGRSIASITFTDGASVPYVSRVEFINEDAWPENSDGFSPYTIGDVVQAEMKGEKDDNGKTLVTNFVCIQSATKGRTGIFFAITPTKRMQTYANDGANKTDGREIAQICKEKWNMISAYMKSAGMPQMKNDSTQNYYFNHWGYYLFWGGVYAINLKTCEETWYHFGLRYRYTIYCYRFGLDGKLEKH